MDTPRTTVLELLEYWERNGLDIKKYPHITPDVVKRANELGNKAFENEDRRREKAREETRRRHIDTELTPSIPKPEKKPNISEDIKPNTKV